MRLIISINSVLKASEISIYNPSLQSIFDSQFSTSFQRVIILYFERAAQICSPQAAEAASVGSMLVSGSHTSELLSSEKPI